MGSSLVVPDTVTSFNMQSIVILSLLGAAAAAPQIVPYVHDATGDDGLAYVHDPTGDAGIEAEPYVHIDVPAEPYVHITPRQLAAAPVAIAPATAPALQPAFAPAPAAAFPAGIATVRFSGTCFNNLGAAVPCRSL